MCAERDTPWSEKNCQVACRRAGFAGAINPILQSTSVTHTTHTPHTFHLSIDRLLISLTRSLSFSLSQNTNYHLTDSGK